MTPDEVLEYYGTAYKFGKRTSMASNTLRNWVRWGFVPELSQLKIEYLTHGELKALLRDQDEHTKFNQDERYKIERG